MLKKMYTRDLFLPTLNIDDLITGKLKEMSNKANKGLHIIKRKISKVRKHYSTPLLLTNEDTSLPNKRNMMEHKEP